MLTVGIDEDAGARRSRRRSATRRCSRRSGATRTAPPVSTTGRRRELERLAADPRVAAIGETGLDYYRDRAPRDDQRARLSRPRSRSRAALGLPLVIHVRDGGRTTDGRRWPRPSRPCAAEAEGVTVILHCFSAPPERVGGGRRGAAGTARSPATSPTRTPTTLREAARAGPRGAAAGRDRLARSWPRSRCAASRTSRPTWSRSPSSWPSSSGALLRRSSRRSSRRTPRASSDGERWCGWARTSSPTPTCSRRSSARPGLEPGDVVLEVGGGEGALTDRAGAAGRAPARDRARPAAAPAALERGRGPAPERRAASRATRCESISRRSSPRRPRWSPTCPTRSRRR